MCSDHLPALRSVIAALQNAIVALAIWQIQKGNGMAFLSLYNNGTWHLHSTFNLTQCIFLSIAWSPPNETKLSVLCGCLCHRDSLRIRASDTLHRRRTNGPNCLKNNKSHVSCKWSRHDKPATQLLYGEKMHVEHRNQFSPSCESRGLLTGVSGSLCRPCLEPTSARF